MVVDLMMCSQCSKKTEKEFIIIREYKDWKNINTNLFCNIECMMEFLKNLEREIKIIGDKLSGAENNGN